MKTLTYFIILLLSLAITNAAVGDFPYPIYGKVTEKNTGKVVSGAEIRLILPDETIKSAYTNKKGYYQIESSTAYSGEKAKLGLKGQEKEITLSGNKLNVNLEYDKLSLKNYAIGAGLTLTAASAYYYFRKKKKSKK
jgi:hypothetical protein